MFIQQGQRTWGNVRTDAEFLAHFSFIVEQIFRALIPGRLVSFHCMNLPTSKARDGYIGLRDFRGDLIRLFEKFGFIYHSEVCIWKDPVVAMQRTKAIGLLHKQICKDSALSRQGIPDYLVTMRKPGVNPEPISGKFEDFIGEMSSDEFDRYCREEFPKRSLKYKDAPEIKRMSFEQFKSVMIWQRYASPVWMDIDQSDTLQYRSAREHSDDKHICPLQLQVIRRALELWSLPEEIVLSPFAGIGSEGVCSVEMGRKFIGHELKEVYYAQAVANLRSACYQPAQADLFEMAEA